MERILITGANGFVGKHLVEELKDYDLITPTKEEANFKNSKVCAEYLEKVDTVIHLAAFVGGIGLNQREPAKLFYENMKMGIELINTASHMKNIQKFVFLGTVCAYPKFTSTPFVEEDIWNGYPEETNAPYGIAKKSLMIFLQAAKSQYGLNGISLFPTNLYGPHDNFNDNSSHVIPALIKKFVDAKLNNKESVEIWGTGNASRDFLYVKDCAKAIRLATEKLNDPQPINLGSGKGIQIKELAGMISALVGYEGKIVYNTEKPDGQPVRELDISKAKTLLDWQPETDFVRGLSDTIAWYQRERGK